jgi:hypothetical protein
MKNRGTDVQKINYYLVNSTNNTPGKNLIRSVTRNLLPTAQETSDDQLLLSGVDDFVLSFFDGSQWRDSWDSTQDEMLLPTAVRVQIYLTLSSNAPTTAQRLPVELVVPLDVASTNLTNSATSSTGGSS